MNVSYDFSGRSAVVTGGSKGIGRCIVERLIESGAEVWVWDLEPHGMEGVGFARVDVTDAAAIAAAIRHMGGEGTGIDILVNNAGFTGGTIAVEDLDPAQWRRILDVNLTGVFEVSRQVVPLMRRSGWGRIVNIASLAGKEGTPNLSAYSAAKAGVIAFTKSLAKELAETDIRVNSVAPAAAETDILKQMDPAAVAAMIAKSPQKRLGRVDEIAEVVLWLCSEACTFNTGASFDVSGGRAVY
jgi:3-oxoacyl-[acyl-carrier protein] reductase